MSHPLSLKWYLQDSNRGHTDFQSDALPTELRHHNFAIKKLLPFLFAAAKVRIISQCTMDNNFFFSKKEEKVCFFARFHSKGAWLYAKKVV